MKIVTKSSQDFIEVFYFDIYFVNVLDRYNVINIDTGIRIGNNGPELEGSREHGGCKPCNIF